MKKILSRILYSIFPDSGLYVFVSKLLSKFQREGFYISYSEYAEDMILRDHLSYIKRGFYVDVGCNRPVKGNNTFRFYLQGWHGINIDGNDKLIQKYKRLRKKDINLTAIVSNENKDVVFYVSDTDKVSTISPLQKEMNKGKWDYVKEITMASITLEAILDKHLPKEQKIDFLNIDVEGHDLEVILSLNIDKYRPDVICIEASDFSIEHYQGNSIAKYLIENNYKIIAATYPNIFFKDMSN